MDVSTVGLLAQVLMERLDDEDFPDGSFVRTVAVAVEVDNGESSDTNVRVACSDSRGWVAAAFMDEARIAFEDARYADRDEAGSED